MATTRTQWPNGFCMDIPSSMTMAALNRLVSKTRMKIRWNHRLGMIEFYQH